MKVQKVGVVGLGTMGSNIAIVCARGGKETAVFEADAQALEAGMGRVRAFLDSGVEKGKTSSEERDAMLGRIHEAESLTGLRGLRPGDRGDHRGPRGEEQAAHGA